MTFCLIALLTISSVRADLIGHGGMIRAIHMSSDGRYVLTGSFDYSAIIWDFGEQREIGRLDGHDGPVTSAHFVNGGERALTASDDKTVILWNVKKRKAIYRLTGHTHKVMSVVSTLDGTHAASGDWDGNVIIWDLVTGLALRTINVGVPVNSVVFLGDTDHLAIGGHDNLIRIYDSLSGRHLGQLEGHLMAITQLSSSRDGTRLLSASIDGSIRLWDMDGFIQIMKLEGHDKQVFAVNFINGETTAISAGRDGTIIHWDLKTGRKLRQILAHKSIIWAVTTSPDGRFALTAGLDETAKVWHLDSGDQIGKELETTHEPKPWLDSDHPGAEIYKKCARCHAFRADLIQRSGPHLENLFGRPVGGVEGYHYSNALIGKSFLWNDETIFELFDKGPDVFLPGTKMPIQKVTQSSELLQLIDYLKELTTAAN